MPSICSTFGCHNISQSSSSDKEQFCVSCARKKQDEKTTTHSVGVCLNCGDSPPPGRVALPNRKFVCVPCGGLVQSVWPEFMLLLRTQLAKHDPNLIHTRFTRILKKNAPKNFISPVQCSECKLRSSTAATFGGKCAACMVKICLATNRDCPPFVFLQVCKCCDERFLTSSRTPRLCLGCQYYIGTRIEELSSSKFTRPFIVATNDELPFTSDYYGPNTDDEVAGGNNDAAVGDAGATVGKC